MAETLCPKCHKVLFGQMAFCSSCGAKAKTDGVDKLKLLIIIIAVLFAVIIIGAILGAVIPGPGERAPGESVFSLPQIQPGPYVKTWQYQSGNFIEFVVLMENGTGYTRGEFFATNQLVWHEENGEITIDGWNDSDWGADRYVRGKLTPDKQFLELYTANGNYITLVPKTN